MPTKKSKKFHKGIEIIWGESDWAEGEVSFDLSYSDYSFYDREVTPFLIHLGSAYLGHHTPTPTKWAYEDLKPIIPIEIITKSKEHRETKLKQDVLRGEIVRLDSEMTDLWNQIKPLNKQIDSINKKVNLITKNLKTRGIDLTTPNFLERCIRKVKNLLGFDRISLKIKEPRKLPFTEAKDQVEEFIAENFDVNEVVYPSDIAEALNLNYNLVFDILNELKKEEKLE